MTKEYKVIIKDDGTEIWHTPSGTIHRENGPAVIYENGNKEWWQNGQVHRTGGPAYENSDGTYEYRVNGKLHRDDGPAVKWSCGSLFYYLDGNEYTKEAYEKELESRKQPSCKENYYYTLTVKTDYTNVNFEFYYEEDIPEHELWNKINTIAKTVPSISGEMYKDYVLRIFKAAGFVEVPFPRHVTIVLNNFFSKVYKNQETFLSDISYKLK